MHRPDPRITHRRPELSQHFLREGSALVRRAALPPGSLVVEPGAGDGVLTAALAEAGLRVIAVEKDASLFTTLRERFDGITTVEAHHADFLTYPLPDEPYHAVSNVPFGITAAVVRRLLHAARPPTTATLIMQREAAAKFAGVPRETAFSLLHKPWFALEITGIVSRREFVPPPRVEAAVLSISRRDLPLVTRSEAAHYRRFIETTLGHGASILAPGLRRYLTARQFARLGRDIGFTRETRTSQLGFDQWLAIFRFVEHECLGHDPTCHNVASIRYRLKQVPRPLLRRASPTRSQRTRPEARRVYVEPAWARSSREERPYIWRM